MATTVNALIDTVREDYLLAGASPQFTKLNGAVATTGTTTVTVDSDAQISTGTRICVGFEEMHVWSTAANVLTVERGFAGTTASTHSDDALVTIAPEYSDAKILRACIQEAEALRNEPGLYRVSHVDYTAPHDAEFVLGPAPDGTSEVGYDGVLEVLAGTDEDTEPWARLPWDVMQVGDADGSDALVTVPDALYLNTTIRIVRRQTLGALASTTTDIETDVGILNADLIAVGAALRLGAGRAIRRTSLHAQGDTRRANEVAAFSTGNAVRELQRRYDRLLMQEKVRLKRRFPMWRKV